MRDRSCVAQELQIQVLTVQDIEQVEDGEAAERVRAAAALVEGLIKRSCLLQEPDDVRAFTWNDSEDEQAE